MTTRIEQLTRKQIAMLDTVRNEWLGHGLATGPADRVQAEEGVRLAYQAAGLTPPRIVIWLDSPLAGAIGAEFLRRILKEISGPQVGDQVRDQVWDQVRAQVWYQVGDQVWAQVWDQVRAQVRDQVWDQVRAQVRDQVGDQVWRAVCGQHEASWLSFFSFFREACELEVCKRLEGLSMVARHAGWWWPFNGAVILTERPTQLHRDAGWRLHSETTAAIQYHDGWGIWAIHGVRVPQNVVEDPASITLGSIEKERNAEVRRVMIERYGLGRYVRDAQFEVLDADIDPVGQPRRLLRRDNLVVVELTNSTEDYVAPRMSYDKTDVDIPASRRKYHVQCHPELRPLLPNNELGEPQKLTALNAVASTYGMTGEEYVLQVET